MTNEVCQIVQRPPRSFWFRAAATLVSPLTPEQVRERLQTLQPRFEIPSHAGGLLRFRRFYYRCRVQSDSFWLSGPHAPETNRALDVRGRIEPHHRGSRIHLTVSPESALAVQMIGWLGGILIPVLWWILDGAFSVAPLIPGLAVGVLLGSVGHALGGVAAGTECTCLLNYLQILFCKQDIR